MPLWLWPNLLSLDAPLIAVVWQDVFARDFGLRLTLASRAALVFAVWLIYLTDRLLDTWNGMPAHGTARHAFYCANRIPCYLLAASSALFLAFSLPMLPKPVLGGGLLVSGVVLAYLVLVHFKASGLRSNWLPKEATVGLVFAVGTALAPFMRASKGVELVFPALAFGILCWLNSAAIELWEGGCLDAVSRWAVEHMRVVAGALGIVCLAMDAGTRFHLSAAALVISAIGYWAVADSRQQVSADLLRVGIDIPLLAPLLLIGLR